MSNKSILALVLLYLSVGLAYGLPNEKYGHFTRAIINENNILLGDNKHYPWVLEYKDGEAEIKVAPTFPKESILDVAHDVITGSYVYLIKSGNHQFLKIESKTHSRYDYLDIPPDFEIGNVDQNKWHQNEVSLLALNGRVYLVHRDKLNFSCATLNKKQWSISSITPMGRQPLWFYKNSAKKFYLGEHGIYCGNYAGEWGA